MTKDEAQRRRWTFYEAVNYEISDRLLSSKLYSLDLSSFQLLP